MTLQAKGGILREMDVQKGSAYSHIGGGHDCRHAPFGSMLSHISQVMLTGLCLSSYRNRNNKIRQRFVLREFSDICVCSGILAGIIVGFSDQLK